MALVVLTSLTALSACDMFSAPKKTESKPAIPPAAVATPATEAPAKVEQEDQGPLPADVVARVGKWKITNDEFNARLKLLKQGLPDFNDKDPQSKMAVLRELVNQQLLVKDAEESDIGQQQDIKDALEDFRRTLLVQELAQRITKGVEAKDEDAQQYYNDNKNLFIRWKIRVIQVDDEPTAKNILVQLLQGGDFASIAKEQSKDKFASAGGLVPEADLVQLPKELQKAISNLESGQNTTVIKTTKGYSVGHVDEKSFVPFSELKDKLKSNLTLRKQQETIIKHIDELSQKTKVEFNQDLLGSTKSK